MGDRIRVVLADDHAVVRKGIKQFLEEAGDVEVIAEAEDGAEALRLVEEHRPDVALLDIRMPEMTGVEATRRIKDGCRARAHPHFLRRRPLRFRPAPDRSRRLRAQDRQQRRASSRRAHCLPGRVSAQPRDRQQGGAAGD